MFQKGYTPWNKGKKCPTISIAVKKYMKIAMSDPEKRKKILIGLSKGKFAKGMLGKKHTDEWKRNMSNRMIGNTFGKNLREEKHGMWKGENASYTAFHHWAKKWLGKPIKCSNPKCNYPRKNSRGGLLIFPKRIEWANKNHKYRRVKEDWISLCTKCHKDYDMKLLNL